MREVGGEVIAAGILIGALMSFIGFSMIKEGGNFVARALGIFLMLIAGGIICMATGGPKSVGYIAPDQNCAQVVRVDDRWTCVPWEEAG